MEKDLIFTDKILDNVHGFISYTKSEGEIIDNILFKRLQSIKQLSLVNWIFPGSEHTRFVHSLGVMHIADKMAIQLELPKNERKIIRFAGLLHDIGHYPLSHLCESGYTENFVVSDEKDFYEQLFYETKDKIDNFKIVSDKLKEPMKLSTGLHHEAIGAEVIKSCEKIKNIITAECGNEAVGMICDIITGKPMCEASENEWYSLMVQILHSEFDADGIDYMLRDAVFSGTSFGSFEVDFLINSLVVTKFNSTKIMCIKPKGIAAADQYLINKFFSYSQVIFNKHSVILEWMAKQVIFWMKNNAIRFPSVKEFIKFCKTEEFLNFTDNFFWNAINSIVENEAVNTFPKYIVSICKQLLLHNELEYVKNSELKLISDDIEEIQNKLRQTSFYKETFSNDKITLLNTRRMSKHIPLIEFEALFESKKETEGSEVIENTDQVTKENEDSDQAKNDAILQRYMEGICVVDNDDNIRLLCDDDRSLMRKLCKTTLVVMRTYKFEINSSHDGLNNGETL